MPKLIKPGRCGKSECSGCPFGLIRLKIIPVQERDSPIGILNILGNLTTLTGVQKVKDIRVEFLCFCLTFLRQQIVINAVLFVGHIPVRRINGVYIFYGFTSCLRRVVHLNIPRVGPAHAIPGGVILLVLNGCALFGILLEVLSLRKMVIRIKLLHGLCSYDFFTEAVRLLLQGSLLAFYLIHPKLNLGFRPYSLISGLGVRKLIR